MLIGFINTTSSLSILLYLSLSALALDNPSDRFHQSLPRRIFPADLSFLEFLHNNTKLTDNIAIPKDQFLRVQSSSLDEKLEGFTGIPKDNRLKLAPLILDTSSLENFYTLLDYSDTRYIVVQRSEERRVGKDWRFYM